MQNVLRQLKELLKVETKINILEQDILYKNRVETLNYLVVNKKEMGISSERYCDQELVVSLTTYDERLYDVYLTIESVMQQTRKANRIVLILANELKGKTLPMSLQLQQKRGLEIHYYRDIKSYKKLIPTLKKYPNEVIITVDDDVVYDIDMIDKLVIAYLDNPNHIYYNRGHKMKLLTATEFDKYDNWEWFISSLDASPLNFPTGVGGILYPPNALNEAVYDEDTFQKICPYADDIWFKAMSLLNGKTPKKVYTRNAKGEDYLENRKVQNKALSSINNLQKQNDIQIKAVFEKFKLFEKL
jgi:hypothetical protein